MPGAPLRDESWVFRQARKSLSPQSIIFTADLMTWVGYASDPTGVLLGSVRYQIFQLVLAFYTLRRFVDDRHLSSLLCDCLECARAMPQTLGWSDPMGSLGG